MKKLLLIGCLVFGFYLVYKGWSRGQDAYSDSQLPTLKHLGIIMDGNRRWARQAGLAPWIGHRKGVDPVKTAVSFCLKQQIPCLTLYAFSLENLKRPAKELDYLFNTLAQEIVSKELDELFSQGVKVRFIGDRTQFPCQLVNVIDEVEQKTKNGDRLQLNILFCYGGRQEIFAAVQQLARAVKEGFLTIDTLSPQDFENFLWTQGLCDPELIIRTGGMQRLSNFLPYQAAYSELYFLKCFWPEITEEHLKHALLWFKHRPRNFGA